MDLGWILFLINLIAVFVLYYKEPRMIWMGDLTITCILLFLYNLIVTLEKVDGHLVPILHFLIVIHVALIMGFILFLAFFFLKEGIKLLKREGFGLRNLLSIGYACVLLFCLIGYFLFPSFILYQYMLGGLLLFSMILAGYTVGSIINQHHHTLNHNLDYEVVLGAGLLDGERISPLLAKRIDRGIEVYHANPGSKIILSGGQGTDEKISEAQAMYQYCLERNIPECDLIQEDQSRNTYQNIRYSYAKMEGKKRFAICTNSYHVFRALIYARRLKIPCIGFSSFSTLYFFLNAFLREVIGFIWFKKKRYITYGIVYTLIFILIKM